MNSTSFGVWVTDVSVLTDVLETKLDDLITENQQCEDLATNSPPLLNHLRASDLKSETLRISLRGYLMRNQSIQSCADVKPYCDSITKLPEFTVDGGHLPARSSDLEGVSRLWRLRSRLQCPRSLPGRVWLSGPWRPPHLAPGLPPRRCVQGDGELQKHCGRQVRSA